jgi:hypothetical protein
VSRPEPIHSVVAALTEQFPQQHAGTNKKATTVTWVVGEDIDAVLQALNANGIVLNIAFQTRLEETTGRIDEIARRCGFSNEEQLRGAFSRHVGIPPRVYRARFAAA